MKVPHLFGIAVISIASLMGCQSTKNVFNGFMGGAVNVAQLPDTSSSRVQFVINDYYGMFIGSPNSGEVKINGKTKGILATRFVSPLFSAKNKQIISASDLDMPKPDTQKKPFNVVERYVNPNQKIFIEYNMGENHGSSTSKCHVDGEFIPKENTDYRITGMSSSKKCYMILEEFTKDKNGQTQLKTIKFN